MGAGKGPAATREENSTLSYAPGRESPSPGLFFFSATILAHNAPMRQLPLRF
jgi:hypothetical protein